MHLTSAAMLLACLLGTAALSTPHAAARPAAQPREAVMIPFETFTLPNGLRVVVHTDRKAPVVAVSIWYHVGSKDERPGRTGFAHLFEHLMFQGSEHYQEEWFKAFEDVGATDVNGTTSLDRTNYFQTVPTTALEMTLWLESDRMGHFLGTLDQKLLDEQRGVVQNEKRQGDNQPYGRVRYLVHAGLFPGGHPYGWTTIGSMEDLEAATLDDARAWFREHYGPSNAVLVLSGDVDTAAARVLVQRYFGDIPAGPPLPRRVSAIPERTQNTRDRLEDRVPQVLLDRYWAVPGRTTREAAVLRLAAHVLGGGRSSRLYRALVHEQGLATGAGASVQPFELASMARVFAMVRAGVEPARAEAALEAVLGEFLERGPTRQELDQARTAIRADFLRGIERVGGFSGKAPVLAEGMLYAGDPGFYRQQLAWLDAATPEEVRATARRWLARGWHQVDVVPVPRLAPAGGGADRSQLPAVTEMPALTLPPIEESRLSNGIPVALVPRPGVPLLEVAVVFDAGFASDSNERPGAADFALDMMTNGTQRRSALEIAAEQEALGARISTATTLDASVMRLSALRERLQPSLELFADVVRNPAFAADEMERQRPRRLARIQQEMASPLSLALRLLPPALYGDGHAYGKPLTGTGTPAAIESLTPADLEAFHRAWIRPDAARIIAVGDVTMGELRIALERVFGDWRAPETPLPQKQVAPVERLTPRVALVDRPDSAQTVILAGRLGPPSDAPHDPALQVGNAILGGLFTSRLNMNLREDKGWSYGASTLMFGARGQRPWLEYAPVQTDRTAEALAEILRELGQIRTDRPVSAEEVERAVNRTVRSLPGAFETNGALLARIVTDASLGRPLDYVTQVPTLYRALDPPRVNGSLEELVRPDDLVWVIVGDRRRIEKELREAGLGNVEIWDEQGRAVSGS